MLKVNERYNIKQYFFIKVYCKFKFHMPDLFNQIIIILLKTIGVSIDILMYLLIQCIYFTITIVHIVLYYFLMNKYILRTHKIL